MGASLRSAPVVVRAAAFALACLAVAPAKAQETDPTFAECWIRADLYAAAVQRHNMRQSKDEVSAVIMEWLTHGQMGAMNMPLRQKPARAWAARMLDIVFSEPRDASNFSTEPARSGFMQACLSNPEKMATPQLADWDAYRARR